MCFGSTPPPVAAAVAQATSSETTFDDSPPVVTGMQTGVENPKDTKKATEELKIKRQKREGTYVDPNLVDSGISAVQQKLVGRSGSNSLAAKQSKINRQNVAKRNFNKKKYSKGITGRKTGTA